MTVAFSLSERVAFAAAAKVVGSAQLARRLGIPDGAVRKWVHRYARSTALPVVEAPALVAADEDLSVTARLADALSRHGTMGAAISALGLRRKDLAGVDWSIFAGGLDAVPDAPAYLITYAQNDTCVHAGFWSNLTAYADHLGARILVGAGTYQVGLYRDHAADPSFYDPAVRPCILKTNAFVARDLLFAATANLLPTVASPLSKWRTRGGKASVIVPHAKQLLESVPRMLEHDPKIAISTGACTVPNYAARAAGQAAAWHHSLGAVIVERDGDGWHLRHVTADDESGAFQDLDVLVEGGVVATGASIDTLVAGDIHAAQVDLDVVRATWGPGGLVERLRPKRQVVHDVLDFHARNHHDRGSVKKRLERLVAGRQSVSRELEETANLLASICREGVETVVVKSNHDDALDRWLDSDDGLKDEENVRLWLHLNARHVDAIHRRERFDPFRAAIELSGELEGAVWPARFSSYEVDYPAGPIELNLHGDRGNAGARGSPMGFVKAAPKIISAHSHTPYRREGHGSVGTSTQMDLGYNQGLSAWAHAHIVVYPSGHWTHVMIKGGRFSSARPNPETCGNAQASGSPASSKGTDRP